jgi:hypothetical protein
MAIRTITIDATKRRIVSSAPADAGSSTAANQQRTRSRLRSFPAFFPIADFCSRFVVPFVPPADEAAAERDPSRSKQPLAMAVEPISSFSAGACDARPCGGDDDAPDASRRGDA